jgi:hypothetical protein
MKKNSKEIPENKAIEEQLREEDKARPNKNKNLPKNKQILHKKKKQLTRLEKYLRLAEERDNSQDFFRRYRDHLRSEVKKTKEIIERLEKE